MALVLLSASLAHATWQDGHDVVLLSAPLTHQPQRVQPPQGRRHRRERSIVCSSWFLTRSSMQIQAWPVHQTRHAGSMAEEEQPAKPLFTKQIADRHWAVPHTVDRRLTQQSLPLLFEAGLFHEADRRQTSCSSSCLSGCQHILTDCQSAGWGLVRRGGRKKKKAPLGTPS